MMKWGKKKTSSSSYSSRLPYLNRVLPAAWLSTFKRSGTNSEPKPAKEKHKGINDSGAVRSSKFGCAEERFYGGDGEAFWRLSFGEDSADGKTSKSVPRSAWYDSEDEHDFAPSSCQSCGSNAMMINEKEKAKIGNMACNVKSPWVLQEMKEFRRDTQILPDTNMHIGEKTTGLRTRRSRTTAEKGLKLKKTNERAVEKEKSKRQNKSGKGLQKSTKQKAEENELEPDTPETVRKVPIIERRHLKLTGDYQRKQQYLSTMNLKTSNLRTIKEDHAFSAQKLVETDIFSPEKLSSEVGKGKEMKTEALNVKSERKSLYMSRELSRRRTKQNNKVRIFSPRTASRVEICKIKALEDTRKAKLKMKTAKQKTISGVTELEDFAMVKCSFDPEKDFRDSMIEMIMEKNINHPEELEELLACYLTLNSDAYHDLIIKVFQQVWFDLDQPSSDTELQNEQYFYN